MECIDWRSNVSQTRECIDVRPQNIRRQIRVRSTQTKISIDKRNSREIAYIRSHRRTIRLPSIAVSYGARRGRLGGVAAGFRVCQRRARATVITDARQSYRGLEKNGYFHDPSQPAGSQGARRKPGRTAARCTSVRFASLAKRWRAQPTRREQVCSPTLSRSCCDASGSRAYRAIARADLLSGPDASDRTGRPIQVGGTGTYCRVC